MFDSPTRFLTLFFVVISSTALVAQDREFMRAVDRLAEPSAIERAEAVNTIASWQGDIGPNMRVAYRSAWPIERMGLLQAAGLREDPALVTLAARDLSSSDQRLKLGAEDYLLRLPLSTLKPDTTNFEPAEEQAWDEFRNLRLQRDMMYSLIEQWLKPGKFFGQFDDLRAHSPEALDEALIDFVLARSDVSRAMYLAGTLRLAEGIEASRIFSASWRRLTEGLNAVVPAADYVRSGQMDFIGESIPTPTFQTGLSMVAELRATAAMALGQTRLNEDALEELIEFYRHLPSQPIEPRYRFALDPRRLLVELEITFARHGVDEFLDARIGRLLQQVDKAREAHETQINLRASSRPDLTAMNEVAHLQLRRGDFEGAERQWQAALRQAKSDLPNVHARFQGTLVSYIGVAYYNLACAQALQLKLSAGLENLKKATEHGYNDFAWMLEDGDLYHIRAREDFAEWFEVVAPPSVYSDFVAQLESDSGR
jgi:tetratricopeptide (TPR) repeat protein